jgi:anti-sigma B factor antagonist
VVVCGAGDLYSAPEFKERVTELLESGAQRIVVDLSGAELLDDAPVLGPLANLTKTRGISVALVVPGESFQRVFEITGLDRVFSLYSTVDEALADQDAAA